MILTETKGLLNFKNNPVIEWEMNPDRVVWSSRVWAFAMSVSLILHAFGMCAIIWSDHYSLIWVGQPGVIDVWCG